MTERGVEDDRGGEGVEDDRGGEGGEKPKKDEDDRAGKMRMTEREK